MLRLKTSRMMLLGRAVQRRQLSSTHPVPQRMEGGGDDFRPPWVYLGARFMSFALIPGVGLYSAFFYDFGEREHVFQPLRRWASEKANIFFTLSPAEERLVQEQRRLQSANTPETAA